MEKGKEEKIREKGKGKEERRRENEKEKEKEGKGEVIGGWERAEEGKGKGRDGKGWAKGERKREVRGGKPENIKLCVSPGGVWNPSPTKLDMVIEEVRTILAFP